MNKEDKSYLLIGNSRWHWALNTKNSWDFIDTSLESNNRQYLKIPLSAWAGVGSIPRHINLDPNLQVTLKDIPLLNTPPWLGIDRALAAWGAFQKAKELSKMPENGLLVADAGTIMSINRINANGKFLGGQLIPGLHLQLTAMSNGTEKLAYPSTELLPKDQFPLNTSEAMLQGSLQALIASLKVAQAQAKVPIWLCGGDAPLIIKSLGKSNQSLDFIHQPNLVLEGMIKIKTLINSNSNQ
tara:strand:+ start:2025 stop:2747 length:723 start_codon:yes stop_codon:yes gene_type:complete